MFKTKEQIEEMAKEAFSRVSIMRKVWTFIDGFRDGYTQAQKDLLESASEGFEEHCSSIGMDEDFWIDTFGKDDLKEFWQACSLSYEKKIHEMKIDFMKVYVEKDAEIERLKAEIMIAVNSLKEINRHLSNEEHVDSSWIKDEIEHSASAYVKNLEFKSKYQESVKDIQKLLGIRDRLRSKLVSMRAFEIVDSVFNPIRIKYGLDKKEG